MKPAYDYVEGKVGKEFMDQAPGGGAGSGAK